MDTEKRQMLWTLLKAVQTKTKQRIGEYCHSCGISVQEAVLLREVASAPGITLVELCRRGGLTKSTASSMIARLEERGILVREVPPENRRTIRLYLVEGFSKRPEVAELKDKLYNDLFGQLTDEETDAVLLGLKILNDRM